MSAVVYKPDYNGTPLGRAVIFRVLRVASMLFVIQFERSTDSWKSAKYLFMPVNELFSLNLNIPLDT